jgi:hypothetical protein
VQRPAATAVTVTPFSITESITMTGPFGERKYGRQTSGIVLGASFRLITYWVFREEEEAILENLMGD